MISRSSYKVDWYSRLWQLIKNHIQFLLYFPQLSKRSNFLEYKACLGSIQIKISKGLSTLLPTFCESIYFYVCTGVVHLALEFEIFFLLFRTKFVPFISIKRFNYWFPGPVALLLIFQSFLAVFFVIKVSLYLNLIYSLLHFMLTAEECYGIRARLQT